MKLLSIIVGLGILFGVAHITILRTGGYADPHAVLVLAIAAGVGLGSVATGLAWREHRRPLAVFIAGAMLAGEMFGIIQTGERILMERESVQAPIRAAIAARKQAEDRVHRAETAVANQPTSSPRLEKALTSKAAADDAVLAKASEKNCAANCRVLLERQIASAEAELRAARDEIEGTKIAAETELATAKATLNAMGTPPSSEAPLATHLGLPGWAIDLITAGLGAVGANGLAAGLLAFGARWENDRPQTGKMQLLEPEPRQIEKPIAPSSRPTARQQAARFGLECLEKDPDSTLIPNHLFHAYRNWCAEKQLEELPAQQFAREIQQLLGKAGITIDRTETGPLVRGVVLRLSAKDESPSSISSEA